ncbi:MAG: phosphate acyltransferase PlsX [Bacteroidetes bacterium]|nr:phosphate acyltransferase PlsX [Bacteroidota bacterium]
MTKSKNIIVVDAMGGDFAPISEVEGGLLAIQENVNQAIPLSIIYVGVREKIEEAINNSTIENKQELLKNTEIVDASEVITMHDDPVVALKTKKDSSMVKGLHLHKEGKADAYISAGNTGATLSIATIMLGRIEGVARPTIGAFLPTSKNIPTFLIDVGATVECKSKFLYEYAVMGAIFYSIIAKTENPSIGLLNVGEEPTKGTAEHIEAYNKLKASNLNFYGNVEGGDIFTRKTDVVVADGYVGNVILKFAESMPILLSLSLKNYAINHPDKVKQIETTANTIKEVLVGLNPEAAGGVPLLGVKGNVIIGHGHSTPTAIKNMITAARTLINENLCSKIENEINKGNL